MPTLTRSKYNISYTLEGPAKAPVLVFSNSLGSDTGMWNTQAAEFAKQFQVVRYDNRGHGQSSAPQGPYTLDDIAGDAVAVIEHLGEKRVHFCGLSLGGMVGMWLASNRPELIHKLVLSNTSALMGPRENWDTRIAAVRQNGMQAVVKGTLERWFTEGFRAKSPLIVSRIEQNFLKVAVDGYAGCCAAIRDMDQTEAITGIQLETLVIAGKFDPSTPPAMGKAIADSIAGAEYVELPAAHLSNIEAAAGFNDIVLKFLA